MVILRAAKDMAVFSNTARKTGKRIAFVPTMGALHEGHLALMREARRHGDTVVVSLFVNPRQFNDPKDFEKYTRDLEGDLKKCEGASVDAVFAPMVDEMYPPNDAAPEVPLPKVAERLEGASRPGHFAGVVAVVSRLFQIVQPDAAIFGLKDYQQVRVIEEMVAAGKLPVQIIRHPIVREKDGLAMSSRNAHLSPTGRQKALALFRSLQEAEKLYQGGERNAQHVREAVLRLLERDPAVKVDYVAVVDAKTLEDVSALGRPTLVAIAAFAEGVRLIDNCILG